uniref:Diguanylate cyclase n=1 Tax=Strongyloides venezuelensis TaxID=75913 RepID=A0A0K0FSP2_STRVS
MECYDQQTLFLAVEFSIVSTILMMLIVGRLIRHFHPSQHIQNRRVVMSAFYSAQGRQVGFNFAADPVVPAYEERSDHAASSKIREIET